MFNTSNTRKAVKEFYLNSHYYGLRAKIMFPFFYSKFLKWIGEKPKEIEEERADLWISGVHGGYSPGNLETIYLPIPLKEQVVVLEWGSGDNDPDNNISIAPLEILKDGKLDFDYWRKHRDQVKNYPFINVWEKAIWNNSH